MSFRPAENVKNEVALVLGFTAKENGPAEAAIGNTSPTRSSPRTANAWLKNPAEEGQAIATMARKRRLGSRRSPPAARARPTAIRLNGFGKALEHARKECAS